MVYKERDMAKFSDSLDTTSATHASIEVDHAMLELDKFKNSFFDLNSRYPSNDEIQKNMKYINDENYSSLSDDALTESSFNSNESMEDNNLDEIQIDINSLEDKGLINDPDEIISDNLITKSTDLDDSINTETVAYL